MSASPMAIGERALTALFTLIVATSIEDDFGTHNARSLPLPTQATRCARNASSLRYRLNSSILREESIAPTTFRKARHPGAAWTMMESASPAA
jgi:hypothetical protein